MDLTTAQAKLAQLRVCIEALRNGVRPSQRLTVLCGRLHGATGFPTRRFVDSASITKKHANGRSPKVEHDQAFIWGTTERRVPHTRVEVEAYLHGGT